jgi:hypothetical protein
LSDGKGDGGLSSTRWASKEKSSSGHFFGLDEIDSDTGSLPGEDLTDHALSDFRCVSVLLKTKALDVSMG